MTLTEVYMKLMEGMKMPLSYLTDPDQRLHVLYLGSSVLLAYYVYWRSKTKGSFLNYLFPKKVWLGKSALVDYGLIFFNAVFKVFLIGPYFIFGFYLADKVEAWLPQLIGYPSFSLPATATIVLYTIVITVANDLGAYIVHLLAHRIPVLWEFHKVHHAATVLNPVTQYRIHPVELILNNMRAILVLGLVTGTFRHVSAYPITEMTVIGANALSFAFRLFGSNLRHSHVPLTYFTWVEHILISPFQHQIHHSNDPVHFNRNFGSNLAIWDWMFGTLMPSQSVGPIRFGIGEDEDIQYTSLWKSLFVPFGNLGRSLWSYRSRSKP